jgi:predicted enzyme related to lactoylglutathione lyase
MSEQQPVLGKFVWHDLMTTDIDKAIAFYSDLFGWTIEEFDMGPAGKYKMIHAAGENHGGFVKLDAEGGVPPHWMCHCTVDDVDAAVARSEKAGGTTRVPATDIPTVGRYAVIADPQGASLSLYKPSSWSEESAAQPAPGTFCWHELLALDPEAEGKFHAEVLGWKISPVDMGPMGTYYLLKRNNEKDAGGMLQKPAASPGPSAWIPYVAVADTRESTERVKELGGHVFMQPTDIPNVGRFSVFADPTGAVMAMLGPST